MKKWLLKRSKTEAGLTNVNELLTNNAEGGTKCFLFALERLGH